MAKFTSAELRAVAVVVWPTDPPSGRWVGMRQLLLSLRMVMARNAVGLPNRDIFGAAGSDEEEHEFCLRLALAHPEKADKALGAGWSVPPDRGPMGNIEEVQWRGQGPARGWVIGVTNRGLMWLRGSANDEPIPPEFVSMLPRAQLLADTWLRIGGIE